MEPIEILFILGTAFVALTIGWCIALAITEVITVILVRINKRNMDRFYQMVADANQVSSSGELECDHHWEHIYGSSYCRHCHAEGGGGWRGRDE
tara:strand:- start:3033 stop:3314 length:282 start_codon:yes stop_codon:yes gene_type:complete